MHLETLLYMLLQSCKTLPPPGPIPDFRAIAKLAQRTVVPNDWVKIPETRLQLGLDDSETVPIPNRYFCWDNEKPQRVVDVQAFEAKARPITNEEYARYLHEAKNESLPASWSRLSGHDYLAAQNRIKDGSGNGASLPDGHYEPFPDTFWKNISIKTVYRPVPLDQAKHWPVFASYDELSACARWMNGRIPTMEEARSIYRYVDVLKTKEADKVLAKTISAVNGYLPCYFFFWA